MAGPLLPARAAELVRLLSLRAHPEGGFYNEVFRSPHTVTPADGRPPRASLTTIDFLLAAGQFSAWHRVASDEVWHLLEGGPLRLWQAEPEGRGLTSVVLRRAEATHAPRHVVPAGWWQAAEPLGDYAYVGATVGPGFDFADFTFGRDDPLLVASLQQEQPQALRLL